MTSTGGYLEKPELLRTDIVIKTAYELPENYIAALDCPEARRAGILEEGKITFGVGEFELFRMSFDKAQPKIRF